MVSGKPRDRPRVMLLSLESCDLGLDSPPVAIAGSARRSGAHADEKPIAPHADPRSAPCGSHLQSTALERCAQPPGDSAPPVPRLPPPLPSSPRYVSWGQPGRGLGLVGSDLQRQTCAGLQKLSWMALRRE